MLKLMKMSENFVLDPEAAGLKDEDKGNSILIPSGGRGKFFVCNLFIYIPETGKGKNIQNFYS